MRDQAKHWAIGKNSLGARKSVVLWCKRRFSEFRGHAEIRAMAGTGRCIEFREHAMLVMR